MLGDLSSHKARGLLSQSQDSNKNLPHIVVSVNEYLHYGLIKRNIRSFNMSKVNENRPEKQIFYSPKNLDRLVNLVKYGTLIVTVPVTLSVLRDDADQDGSFLLKDAASTGNYHRKSQSEPAAPLPASVIRRVFFYWSLLWNIINFPTHTTNKPTNYFPKVY